MRKAVKQILKFVMWLVSKVYPYKLSLWLRGFRNVLYTMWIKNFLRQVGDGTVIVYPCIIEGGGQRITIGERSTIQGHTVLGCWEKFGKEIFDPSIKIGGHCSIGEYNHITACNKVTIGDGLLTGRFVFIGDNDHGGLSLEEGFVPPAKRRLVSKGAIVIGDNVWIGDKVTILAGVHVGDNVIVAANAVVTGDIPSNCLVAGVPAKIVKQIEKTCQNQD